MKAGTTKSGFKFEVDAEILESWDFVELLAEVEDNPLKSVALLKMLLGDKQVLALKEHLGNKPKATEMLGALTEIMNAIGTEAKNS